MGDALSAAGMADTQVAAIVRQIEAQGPAVVQRVTTQFADVACTADNARKLVEGLRGGTAVTLSAQGRTATFTPTAKLGYGEAYLAMALAAEALRNAGVSGCATPEQWQSALLGGPLAAASSTASAASSTATASASTRFPGVLALRAQGQGWGQIAQTTNIQLNRIVADARSALNLNLGTTEPALTPTGRSSSEINRPRTDRPSTRGQEQRTQNQASPGSPVDRSRTDADTTPSTTSPTSTGPFRPSTSTTPSTDRSPSTIDPSRSSSAPGQSTTTPGAATRPDGA